MSPFNNKKVVVVAIDGLPFSFFPALKKYGSAPWLASRFDTGEIFEMTTTLPPVSSVAWAGFQTGAAPARHGITGFVDRKPGTYLPFVPTFAELRLPSLYQYLSNHSLRVCSIGMPLTYPPPAVNGIIVSGFLAPSLEKAAYPQSVVSLLKSSGYALDIDAWAARKSEETLFSQLTSSLAARIEIAGQILRRESWDLFVVHILETDRLNHFLWRRIIQDEKEAIALTTRIYAMVDRFISEIESFKTEDTVLVALSDHGFTELKKVAYVNKWLSANGYLSLESAGAKNLTAMSKESKVFSMAPGRIYLHIKGSCPDGSVNKGIEAETLRREVIQGLMKWKDIEDRKDVIKEVVDMRERWGDERFESSPLQLPDLIAVPNPGFELKGDLTPQGMFGGDDFTGMHAYGDAFLYLGGKKLSTPPDITDVAAEICSILGVPAPTG